MNINDPGPVLCFGELLFRISQDAGGDWLKEEAVPFYIGGAELNVALALALWDVPVEYVTALPPNNMTVQIAKHLNNKGVGTKNMYQHGNRVGLYYLTQGADIKNNSLIYDRTGSAFSELKTGMIDWDKVLDGVSWFHFSAICPAINQNIADVCEEALIAASARNITISVDLNYRPRLWQYGKSPLQVMPRLLQYCTFIMGNIWAAETMLGIPVEPNIHDIGEKSNYLKAALKSSRQLVEKYPKCTVVANTFRFDAGDGIKYYTALHTASEFHTTTEHTAAKIVNKVGSGDCFMAGLIYGFYKGLSPAETLDFATRAAFDKLFIKSDSTTSRVDDIKKPVSR